MAVIVILLSWRQLQVTNSLDSPSFLTRLPDLRLAEELPYCQEMTGRLGYFYLYFLLKSIHESHTTPDMDIPISEVG